VPNEKTIKTVHDLAGEELAAVSFVRDYVEFLFDGPVLRSLTSPRIVRGDTVSTFPERGSRDALCSAIGAKVTSVELKEDDSFVLIFGNGDRIIIPLDKESGRKYEAMEFMPEPYGLIHQIWE
jgi:hypothetical protein